MSFRWKLARMVALALMLGFGASSAALAADTSSKVVTLRADPSCPSNCEPDSDHPGYDIEIARKVFGDAGYQVDYKLLSWARTIVEVRSGAIDGFVAGIKEDAPDFIFPEEPAGQLTQGFAFRKGAGWTWTGPQSLDGKVLGVIPDYQYFPELKSYIEAHSADPKRIQTLAMMSALELNLKKLSIGRIDLTCDDISALRYYSKQLGLTEKLDISPPVGDIVPNYIAFGPNNPRSHELARIWDNGIRRMRASGQLATILERYGLRDWK